MSLLEYIAWLLIWSTHWMGWHQTAPLRNDHEHVWCVDCLGVRRK